MHVCVRYKSFSLKCVTAIVWPDGVLGGRNVVQSQRVGGYTHQAKAGGAPFTEEPLSSMTSIG